MFADPPTHACTQTWANVILTATLSARSRKVIFSVQSFLLLSPRLLFISSEPILKIHFNYLDSKMQSKKKKILIKIIQICYKIFNIIINIILYIINNNVIICYILLIIFTIIPAFQINIFCHNTFIFPMYSSTLLNLAHHLHFHLLLQIKLHIP